MNDIPKPPPSYYHVSPVEHVDSILNSGLLAEPPVRTPWELGSKRPRSVHFAVGLSDAAKWARQVANAHVLADQKEADEGGWPADDTEPDIAIFKVTPPEGARIRTELDSSSGLMEAHTESDIPPENLKLVTRRGNRMVATEDLYPTD